MNFENYCKSLPEPLSASEQKRLFLRLSELKKFDGGNHSSEYYAIRDEIISHSLRLCLKKANDYCTSIGNFKSLEDVYGECVLALSVSVDQFNPEFGTAFSTYAYTSMTNNLNRLYNTQSVDALSYTAEKIENKDGEIIDVKDFVADPDESRIAEDFTQKEIIREVLGFIENSRMHTLKKQFKMYYGIGLPNRYTINEIATEFNKPINVVSLNIARFKAQLENFIASKFGNCLDVNFEQMGHLSKKQIYARNNYIFNSYLGINNCVKKSIGALSKEFEMPESDIRRIISDIKHNLTSAERKKIAETFKNSDKTNLPITSKQFANDYFGLGGCKILTDNQLKIKYGYFDENRAIEVLMKFFNPEELIFNLKKRKAYFSVAEKE